MIYDKWLPIKITGSGNRKSVLQMAETTENKKTAKSLKLSGFVK
jgi:hypothetical protein